jgi:hypothetical protein
LTTSSTRFAVNLVTTGNVEEIIVAMAVASRAAERRVARQRTSGGKGLSVPATGGAKAL